MKTIPTATTRAGSAPRRQGLLRGIIHWVLDIDDIAPEEARERMSRGRSFLDSLTPEQLEYLRNYDGPEYLGPPDHEPKRGVLARVRGWLTPAEPPTELSVREEARRRLRSKPGFFSTLSPEARAAVLSYDGPERLGDPAAPR
jgi:hypothetical protein